MQREHALVGAAAVVLVVAVLFALVAPGALADAEDDPEPQPDGRLDLSEARLIKEFN
ncbi:hypothetical protein HSBGL_1023 [Halapricum desulfuricans]|uniref:Uncharacterized protein n=1 Tax=Halapricum desulfuricans TaxID=2841257 RepID=A0A897NAK9_9EURY|nr:hypothetical protein [Halapricum desulfuricans]QSG11450.1 hypothetical protein HSBGL_1023 [Halapricum desulfuricans]